MSFCQQDESKGGDQEAIVVVRMNGGQASASVLALAHGSTMENYSEVRMGGVLAMLNLTKAEKNCPRSHPVAHEAKADRKKERV